MAEANPEVDPQTDPEETQEMDATAVEAALEQNAIDEATAKAYRQPGRGRHREEPEIVTDGS